MYDSVCVCVCVFVYMSVSVSVSACVFVFVPVSRCEAILERRADLEGEEEEETIALLRARFKPYVS